jgi:hypothetical protein
VWYPKGRDSPEKWDDGRTKKTTMDGVVEVPDKVHLGRRVYGYNMEALDEWSTGFVDKFTKILSCSGW